MEQVRISRIDFENYRQFGTGSLLFNRKGKYDLTAFVATNGTGKTTLLNALTWCLYGKEHLLLKRQPNSRALTEKSLPLVNERVLYASEIGETIDVSVSVTIVDTDRIINFKRTHACQIRERNGVRSVNDMQKSFVATITPTTGKKNSDSRVDQEADAIVKQYFDESIYSFYFFDGENLKNYFDAEQAERIKQSIHNISQISLLEHVLKRIQIVEGEAQKKLGKGAPELQEKLKEKHDIDDEILDYEKKIQREKDDEKSAADKAADFRRQIALVKPGEDLLKKKENLLRILDQIKKAFEDLDRERSAFIRNYMTILPIYPSVVKVIKLIERKEKNKELPPSIDKAVVQRIINGEEKTCPVCAQDISDEAITHLMHLLKQLKVSTSTSNQLMEIKNQLYQIRDEAHEYPVKRDSLQQRRQELEREKAETQNQLRDVKALLGNETTRVNKKGPSVAFLTEKLLSAEKDEGFHHDQVVRFEDRLSSKKREAERLSKEIEVLQEKAKTNGLLQKEFSYYSELRRQFERIRDNITGRMRSEIERYTYDIFMNMSTKTRTFGRISIDDEYHITVYNTTNNPMTPNLSDTETMSLAYAFTLAIHQASGKNCPLVIDSPLGKTSDSNRQNMTSVLKDISQKKQLIMCFTPDEYSENIQHILRDVDRRDLKLGEDETTIEIGLVVE